MKLIASASTISRRDDKIALVLAVLVVDDDDEAPLPKVVDRRFDRRQWHPGTPLPYPLSACAVPGPGRTAGA